MDDSYHTQGAIKDRAGQAQREREQINELAAIRYALERIADVLENETKIGGALTQPGRGRGRNDA